MMYKEDIQKIDKWFDKHTENLGTHCNGEEYSVDLYDLEDFISFLEKEFPCLLGIRCYVGAGISNIWFFKKDLEKADFY